MQLTCPECGEPIPAENINIQRMTAVCPACNTVFQFEPTTVAKAKRRKVKQPERLRLTENADHWHAAFRTNFRLDKDENFLVNALVGAVFTFTTLGVASQYVAGNTPVGVMLSLVLICLGLYYGLALRVYNRTHIDMDDERISVSRRPLPRVLVEPRVIGLERVHVIRCAETAVSKKEGYDTPRYNVWAETIDGSRRMIVQDVLEDYAMFITQELNERLIAETVPDVSRLATDDSDDEVMREVSPETEHVRREQHS